MSKLMFELRRLLSSRQRAVGFILGMLWLAGCGAPVTVPPSSDATHIRASGWVDDDLLAADRSSAIFDYYATTEQQAKAVQTAHDVFLTKCMKEQGFVYKANPVTISSGEDWRRKLDSYIGITSPHSAETAGYQGYQDNLEPLLSAENSPPDSDSYVAALMGESNGQLGGCMGELNQAIYDRNLPNVAGEERWFGELAIMATTDERTEAAFTQWSKCMENSGYHYARPLDARADFIDLTFDEYGLVESESTTATEGPTVQELATAKADITCKRNVGLADTWATVTADAERTIAQRYQPVFVQAQQNWLETVRRAEAIIAGNY
ncbi:MAG: hypothetical protein LBG70_02335 [Bifidobacteriaceae bacterium]|jgi:hypothetical protein|nr:hypothetical protein [Bifidobacteriaceae bacterium]